MKLIIVGSGMAGAMAAGYYRHLKPLVHEARKESGAMSGHHAIMWLKDSKVGVILGSPVEEVIVDKAVYYKGKLFDKEDITMSNLYSLKVDGCVEKRSIKNLDSAKRYVLKTDVEPDNVKYSSKLCKVDSENKLLTFVDSDGQTFFQEYNVCINTIPLPALLNIEGIADEFDKESMDFKSQPIYVSRSKVTPRSKVYQTIYFPEHCLNTYRASIEGQVFIMEAIDGHPKQEEVEEVCAAFGLDLSDLHSGQIYEQRYGKIESMNDDMRRWVIMHLSEKFGIYSLGRFATWKNLRVDDLVNDLDAINGMLNVSDIQRAYKGRLR